MRSSLSRASLLPANRTGEPPSSLAPLTCLAVPCTSIKIPHLPNPYLIPCNMEVVLSHPSKMGLRDPTCRTHLQPPTDASKLTRPPLLGPQRLQVFVESFTTSNIPFHLPPVLRTCPLRRCYLTKYTFLYIDSCIAMVRRDPVCVQCDGEHERGHAGPALAKGDLPLWHRPQVCRPAVGQEHQVDQ